MPQTFHPDPVTWRRGVRICLDWGKARIGVAACDPDGVLAYPVETIRNGPGELERVRARIQALVAEFDAIEVLMGLPTDLRGQQGPAALAIREIAGLLAATLEVPLRLVDERLTTAVASRQLAEAGRSSRQRRTVIDQAAAVAILENALEVERRTGGPVGDTVLPSR